MQFERAEPQKLDGVSASGPLECMIGGIELALGSGASLEIERGACTGRHRIRLGDSARVRASELYLWAEDTAIEVGSDATIEDAVIVVEGPDDSGQFVGRSNHLQFHSGCKIRESRFLLKGQANRLDVREKAYAGTSNFHLMGYGCRIDVGRDTSMDSASLLAEELETAVEVGADCMIAPYATLSTGDQHSICHAESGARVSPAKSVRVGNHVWLAKGVLILKGAEVGDNCIVGLHTAVLQPILDERTGCLAENVLIGKSPARILRSNVEWERHILFDREHPAFDRFPEAGAQSECNRGHGFVRVACRQWKAEQAHAAGTSLNNALDAYARALEYKPDLVFARSGRAHALLRLAGLALEADDVEGARASLHAAVAELAEIGTSMPKDAAVAELAAKRALQALTGPTESSDRTSTRGQARAHACLARVERINDLDLYSRRLTWVRRLRAEAFAPLAS